MYRLPVVIIALALSGCDSQSIQPLSTVENVSGVYNMRRDQIDYKCGDSETGIIDNELGVQVVVSEYDSPNTIEITYARRGKSAVRYVGWREGNKAKLYRRLVMPHYDLSIEIQLTINFTDSGFYGVDMRSANYDHDTCAGVAKLAAIKVNNLEL